VIELADIVTKHGDEYLNEFGDRMLPSHKRALDDIVACRTESMGGHLAECEACGHQHYSYHSCKNRSCPKCHTSDTKRWLEKREAEMLPVRYFHVVFTLPQELRNIVRSNQKELYAILMQAAAEMLLKLGHDPKHVGGQLAILAVLHTWTRAMEFHPHVHMLIPAGGLDKDGHWRTSRKKWLVPVKALSILFRARFMKLAQKVLPEETFPQELWKKQWVVYCKPPMTNSKKVLRYLGRYVHRIAIANSRIESMDNGKVTFRYQESATGTLKRMTVTAREFLRRYLQHVLPQGFHKVRYYGLLSPANRVTLQRVHLLLAQRSKKKAEDIKETEATKSVAEHLCPCCSEGIMVVISWLPRRSRSPPKPEMKQATPAEN
jgi:hypothetical protein